jgi:DNA-binding PadR family transcriptional regulator
MEARVTGVPGDGSPTGPLSATDFHVLMVLADGPSYGYAIMKAVESTSGGALTPEIGSMYRVLSRLMSEGWVEEVESPADEPSSGRGRARRYYGLTRSGMLAARTEARRLAEVVELARTRDLLVGRGPA